MKKYKEISEPRTSMYRTLMRSLCFQTGIVNADIFVSYDDLKAAQNRQFWRKWKIKDIVISEIMYFIEI